MVGSGGETVGFSGVKWNVCYTVGERGRKRYII